MNPECATGVWLHTITVETLTTSVLIVEKQKHKHYKKNKAWKLF